jgi:PmbA protein
VENEAFLGTAEAAITSAIRMGAQLAEAYICNSKELKIEVREGRVETMKLAGNRGMGLRVVRDSRTGFSFSTDLSPAGVKEAAAQAIANCGLTAEDPFLQLPSPGVFYPELDIYDPAIRETTVEEKIDLARF